MYMISEMWVMLSFVKGGWGDLDTYLNQVLAQDDMAHHREVNLQAPKFTYPCQP